jgi:tryptophan-rich sensory protein
VQRARLEQLKSLLKFSHEDPIGLLKAAFPMLTASRHQVLGLIGWFTLVFAAAAVGAGASVEASFFYAKLIRPSWAPAAWLFGPVWTLLYVLMGVSAWLVWCARGFAGAQLALSLFFVQLAVNGIWSWLFFAWHLGNLALMDIVVLWFLIVATVISFWPINRLAAALLMPYLVWVTFASILTFSIVRLNPLQLAG